MVLNRRPAPPTFSLGLAEFPEALACSARTAHCHVCASPPQTHRGLQTMPTPARLAPPPPHESQVTRRKRFLEGDCEVWQRSEWFREGRASPRARLAAPAESNAKADPQFLPALPQSPPPSPDPPFATGSRRRPGPGPPHASRSLWRDDRGSWLLPCTCCTLSPRPLYPTVHFRVSPSSTLTPHRL